MKVRLKFCFIHRLLLLILISIGYKFEPTLAVEEIKIGILIRHRGLEEPLNRTLENLNQDNSVLLNTRLTAIVEFIESDNTYQASAAICRLLKQQVWTIIGPQSIQLTPIIQSITSYYHIPLVLINWQPHSYHLDNSTQTIRKRQAYDKDAPVSDIQATNEYDNIPTLLNYTINLYPVADQLSKAYYDLVVYKQWKSFSLIYDNSENFLLVKDILEASFKDIGINVQKINLPVEYPKAVLDYASSDSSGDPDNESASGNYTTKVASNEDTAGVSLVRKITYCNFEGDSINLPYRVLMKDLRKRGVENLVLSMSLDKICNFFKEAANVGLLTVYNDYLIANLDMHLLNLTQFQPLITNITGYSILDPEGQPVGFTPSKMWLGKRPTDKAKTLLSTEYAMMSDAISLIAYSLDELTTLSDFGKFVTGPREPSGSSCGPSEAWLYGDYLVDILKRTPRFGGYTGDIKFDKFGQRTDFKLEFLLHRNNTFKKVGAWTRGEKLRDHTKSSFDEFGLQAIKNKTLKVSIALTSPYVMYRPNYTELSGNDRYEGYCVDLMNKLARKLQFKFVLKEVADGQYGKINPNGSWTGMVRELLDWQADLAIVDLTITKERQSAVDFTHPFMTLGIAIMYKKPKLEEAELYSFLMPLSKEVWLSMWSAYLGISLTIWMISRLSPLEWKNPHPCFDVLDDRDLENEIHSIGASLWFTIGSLMQQGSDLAPRSPSVRTSASVWYFFTLILISSYTANFAAFLTASRMQSPIESAEDLSKQTKIDYGCKEGGSTQAFFQTSNHSTYRRMWNFMESRKHQGVFPKDNNKGINMVKKGNFAFLMESTSIDYMVQRDCELTQIGGLLDHKGYGIALRKRSPFRAPLSKSIVELNEAGELQELKNKWWNTDKTKCDAEKDSALATSELGIDKVGGVFVLLGGGLSLACLTAIMEFVWKSLKTSRDQRDTIGMLLWREFLRILKFAPSKRPATEAVYNKSSTSQQSVNNLNQETSINNNNSSRNNLSSSTNRNIPPNGHLDSGQPTDGLPFATGSALLGPMSEVRPDQTQGHPNQPPPLPPTGVLMSNPGQPDPIYSSGMGPLFYTLETI